MSSRIIMQLCEDSLTFKNDLGILFKQQAKQNKTKWHSKQNTYHGE